MATILILGLLGLVCIYLECFIPGGAMAAVGVLCFMGGYLLAYIASSEKAVYIVYTALIAILLPIVIYIALKKIKKSGKKAQFYLEDDQEGFKASVFNRSLIGKEAITSSPLKPSGYVELEGTSLQVVSEQGFIQKGVRVIILRGEGSRYIVKKIK